jgi:hypothetical protein
MSLIACGTYYQNGNGYIFYFVPDVNYSWGAAFI